MSALQTAESDAGPVNLSDYADAFQAVIPGAELRTSAYGGVRADWHVQVEQPYDRASNAKHAVAMVTQLAEQMRLRAIRELGLEPILEAMRAEVRAFKDANARLQAICDTRASRIADLEEALELAREEHSDD